MKALKIKIYRFTRNSCKTENGIILNTLIALLVISSLLMCDSNVKLFERKQILMPGEIQIMPVLNKRFEQNIKDGRFRFCDTRKHP